MAKLKSGTRVYGTAGIDTSLTVGSGVTITGTSISVTGISTFINGPVLIGSATSTGTATQRLQVTGGAYVSGSLGIGTMIPQESLSIGGNIHLANTGTYIKKEFTDNVEEVILRGPALSAYHPYVTYTRSTGTSTRGYRFSTHDNNGTRSDWFTIWNGAVGVNSSFPTSTVDIFGAQTNSGATSASVPSGTLRLAVDGASETGNYGSSLVFTQKYFSGQTSQIAVGQIAGVKIAGGGNYGGGLALFTSNGSSNNLLERVRIDNSGNLGIGISTPQFQLQTTGNALINGQYLVDRWLGYWNDPGSYPEYMLLGRNNSGDLFRILGSIYGSRGGGGERNTFFNICASKTTLPSTNYTAGNRLGSAGFSLVTLTYAGNSWLALQSGSAGNTGGLNLFFTGQIYHSYSSTQWVHQDFYGSNTSIPSGSVSGVSAAIVTF